MDSLGAVVSEVLRLKGLDVLESGKLFCACLSDIGGADWRRETDILARNLDDRMLQALRDVVDDGDAQLSIVKGTIAFVLSEERGLAKATANNLASELVKGACMYAGMVFETGAGRDEAAAIDLAVGNEACIQWDRGYVSEAMVTDAERMEAVLHDPYVLITRQKITGSQDIRRLLEEFERMSRPLFVIADDIDGDLLKGRSYGDRRNVGLVAVKAPGYGDRRKRILEDLALVTGGQVVGDGYDVSLSLATAASCGRARVVRVTEDSFQIIDGAGSREDIVARMRQIEYEIDSSVSDFDRDKLRERLGKLGGYVRQLT